MDNRFVCRRCKYTTPHKACLINHLKRKNTCEVCEGGQDIEVKDLLAILLHQHIDKPYVCNHCQAAFAYQPNLSRHRRQCGGASSSQPNPTDGSVTNTILKEVTKAMRELANAINNSRNVTINNNINSNNNTQHVLMNGSMTPNNFGHETIQHITNEFLSQCVSNHHDGLRDLIENIYFNPQIPANHNMFLYRSSRKLAARFENDQWNLCNVDDALHSLIHKGTKILYTHFNENMVHELDNDRTQITSSYFMSILNKKAVNYKDLKKTLYAMLFDKTLVLFTPEQMDACLTARNNITGPTDNEISVS